jgi:hypothetical protein
VVIWSKQSRFLHNKAFHNLNQDGIALLFQHINAKFEFNNRLKFKALYFYLLHVKNNKISQKILRCSLQILLYELPALYPANILLL